jgi:hypothetical protein
MASAIGNDKLGRLAFAELKTINEHTQDNCHD